MVENCYRSGLVKGIVIIAGQKGVLPNKDSVSAKHHNTRKVEVPPFPSPPGLPGAVSAAIFIK